MRNVWIAAALFCVLANIALVPTVLQADVCARFEERIEERNTHARPTHVRNNPHGKICNGSGRRAFLIADDHDFTGWPNSQP